METVRELSADQKLAVIDDILSFWKEKNYESYICPAIVWSAFFGYYEYRESAAIELIPELMMFKPDELPEYGWFGYPGRYGERRTQVLQMLRDIISKK
jgi:hypothetical protein